MVQSSDLNITLHNQKPPLFDFCHLTYMLIRGKNGKIPVLTYTEHRQSMQN